MHAIHDWHSRFFINIEGIGTHTNVYLVIVKSILCPSFIHTHDFVATNSLNEALVQMDKESAKVVKAMPSLAASYERLVQLDLRCVQIAKFLFYYTTCVQKDLAYFLCSF
jgi:hypothetical protein